MEKLLRGGETPTSGALEGILAQWEAGRGPKALPDFIAWSFSHGKERTICIGRNLGGVQARYTGCVF